MKNLIPDNIKEVLRKIPFLYYFFAIALIAIVLQRADLDALVGKQFPSKIFFSAIGFALILYIIVSSKKLVNERLAKIVVNTFIGIVPIIVILFITSIFMDLPVKSERVWEVIKKFQEVLESKDQDDQKKLGVVKSKLMDLKKKDRRISFVYDYSGEVPAFLSLRFLPVFASRNEHEYPMIPYSISLDLGINFIAYDFSDLDWEYLRNEDKECNVDIVAYVSRKHEREEIIARIEYRDE